MIFELPPAVQLAIKLRAIKDGKTTGQVVEAAIRIVHPDDWKEAEECVARQGD